MEDEVSGTPPTYTANFPPTFANVLCDIKCTSPTASLGFFQTALYHFHHALTVNVGAVKIRKESE